MGGHPNHPIYFHSGPQLFVNFARNFIRLSIHQLHPREEASGPDRCQCSLVNDSLGNDSPSGLGRVWHDGFIKHTVPVMSHRARETKPKDAHLGGATYIPRLSRIKVGCLRHYVAQHEASKCRYHFGLQRMGIKRFQISRP